MDRYTLEMNCKTNPPDVSWGSVLHGMLIEHLTDEWKQKMHDENARPLSQWIEVKDGATFVWHVNILDDRVSQILEPCLTGKSVWECRHMKTQMEIASVKKEHADFYEYMTPFFEAEEACRGMFLNFRTPATHKTRGNYAVFPSVDLIAGNLNRRICSIEPEFALEDPEALEQVINYTRINRYKLNSARYELEGSGITGYMGYIELRFNGPDPLRRLAGVLFGFARWSGVGIKTALGMGGCDVNLSERRH